MVVECAARPLVFRNQLANWNLDNDQGIGWADSEGPFSFDGVSADGSAEGCGAAGGCSHAMNMRNDNEPYSFHPGGGNFLFVMRTCSSCRSRLRCLCSQPSAQ